MPYGAGLYLPTEADALTFDAIAKYLEQLGERLRMSAKSEEAYLKELREIKSGVAAVRRLLNGGSY
jgi:hypothetical protein